MIFFFCVCVHEPILVTEDPPVPFFLCAVHTVAHVYIFLQHLFARRFIANHEFFPLNFYLGERCGREVGWRGVDRAEGVKKKKKVHRR